MDEEIKKLIEENLRLTREIHEMVHKVKNYINFQKVMSLFYFMLIVGPIILGIIYLPPLIKGMLGQYESLLGAPTGSLQSMFDNVKIEKNTAGEIDLQKLLDSVKK